MSRSYRKTPIFPLACTGRGEMKKWKKKVNRRFRRREKQMIQTENFEEVPLNLNEIEGLWSSPCDGKVHWFRLFRLSYVLECAEDWRKDWYGSKEERAKKANWFLNKRWRGK